MFTIGLSSNVFGLLTDNIVSYYAFENNVVDSLSLNNLTTSGSVSYVDAVVNKGIYFDTSGENAIDTSFNSLGMNSSINGITMCAWINSTSSSAYQRVILLGGSLSNQRQGFQFRDSTPLDWLVVWKNVVSPASDTSLDMPIYVNNSKYFYVCFINNATNTSVYINGIFNKTTTSGSSYNIRFDRLFVGQDTSATSEQFLGVIDELGIWNRSLNSTEISELYNSGNGLTYPFTTTPPTPTNTINFISQSPSNLTALTLFSTQLNMSYKINNYTGGFNNTYLNYSVSVGLACINVLNGTCIRSNNTYQQLITYTTTGTSLNETNISFSLGENNAYPSIELINYTLFNQSHIERTLGLNDLLVTEYVGFNSSINQQVYLEFMANTSVGGIGQIYLCNNNYVSGNIQTDPNCQLINTLSTQTYNHTHGSFSKHNFVGFEIINGRIGGNGITVTETMYFGIRRQLGTIYYYTINNTARSTTTKTSNNNGVTYSAENYTLDTHIHNYPLANNLYLNYQAYTTFNTTSTNTSLINELIDIFAVAPTSPEITIPNSNIFTNSNRTVVDGGNTYYYYYYNYTVTGTNITWFVSTTAESYNDTIPTTCIRSDGVKLLYEHISSLGLTGKTYCYNSNNEYQQLSSLGGGQLTTQSLIGNLEYLQITPIMNITFDTSKPNYPGVTVRNYNITLLNNNSVINRTIFDSRTLRFYNNTAYQNYLTFNTNPTIDANVSVTLNTTTLTPAFYIRIQYFYNDTTNQTTSAQSYTGGTFQQLNFVNPNSSKYVNKFIIQGYLDTAGGSGYINNIQVPSNLNILGYPYDLYTQNLSIGTYYVKVCGTDSLNLQSCEQEQFYLGTNTQLNITARYNTTINNFTINDLVSGTNYTTTTGLTQIELIRGQTYQYRIDAPGYAYAYYNYTPNTSYYQYNFTILPTNSINVTVRDELTDVIITTQNVTLKFEKVLSPITYTYITTTGNVFAEGLSAGNYTLIISSTTPVSYTTKYYNIEIFERGTTTLTAYLNSGGDVLLNYKTPTGQPIEGVDVLIQRSINGSFVNVETLTSQIDGRTKFSYLPATRYRIVSTKIGYNDLTFELNPVLFTSYDVIMTSTSGELITPTAYAQYSPRQFYKGQTGIITYRLISPYDSLVNYTIKTYKNAVLNYTHSGTNTDGTLLYIPIDFTNAVTGDTYTIYYEYNLDNDVYANYTDRYTVIVPLTNRTLINMGEEDFGLGTGDKILIVVFLNILAFGVGFLVGGTSLGAVLMMINTGIFTTAQFIPSSVFYISLVLGVFIIISRGVDNG